MTCPLFEISVGLNTYSFLKTMCPIRETRLRTGYTCRLIDLQLEQIQMKSNLVLHLFLRGRKETTFFDVDVLFTRKKMFGFPQVTLLLSVPIKLMKSHIPRKNFLL